MCSTQHVPMLTPWYCVFSAGAIRGPSTVWGNGLPRRQNPPRISKGAKLEREAQPVVSPAPHPDLLDVVVGQRVMAQQGGFVRGQVEQRRALARARCFVSACSTAPLSVHPDRRGAVRKGIVQRTAQPVAPTPAQPEPVASHMHGTETIAEAGPYSYTSPMTATLIGYARCSTDRQDLDAQR